ncbi:hypothetical protein [Anabaenopsis elenkinii]|nr:hypothetical protein [Anabaenopsis elenkinii]
MRRNNFFTPNSDRTTIHRRSPLGQPSTITHQQSTVNSQPIKL